MISHLCCIRIHTIYTKWSYISRPYLLCTKQKGVQALRLRLGKWMAPLSSCIFNPLTPSRGNTKRLRPTRMREKKMKLKLLVVSLLLVASSSLMAQGFLSGSTPTSVNGNSASGDGSHESKRTVMGGSLRWALSEGATGYGFQYELGFRLAQGKPVFALVGLEYASSNSKVDIGTTHAVVSISALNIPITLGYRFGNPEEFDLFLQGGIRYGFLLSAKYNGDSMLSQMDRSSFSGIVRAAAGYASIRFFVEYGFPFGSGDGVWSIGLSYGFKDKSF